MVREVVGGLGALVVALSACYYLTDVVRGRTRPHRASWAVWAVIGVLGFGTADVSGAGPGAWAAGVDAIACAATFALSLHPRFGKPGGRASDAALGAVALLGVALWRWGPLSITAAALLAVGCDAVALWPTVREGWHRPELESAVSWSADVLGNGLCIAVATGASVAALAYPVYLFAACLTMAALLVVRRRAPGAIVQRSAGGGGGTLHDLRTITGTPVPAPSR